MTDPNPHEELIRELTARSSPREALIRDVTVRIGDRKVAEALVSAFLRATKDERGNRPDMSAQVERIVAAYGCLTGTTDHP